MISAAWAQVPGSVKIAFASDQPGVKAQWKKGKSTYDAYFVKDGKKNVWGYDASGNVRRRKEEVYSSDLSAAVVATLDKSFPASTVLKGYRYKSGRSEYYILNVKTSSTIEKLKLSSFGTIIAQQTKVLPGSQSTQMASSQTPAKTGSNTSTTSTMRGESFSTASTTTTTPAKTTPTKTESAQVDLSSLNSVKYSSDLEPDDLDEDLNISLDDDDDFLNGSDFFDYDNFDLDAFDDDDDDDSDLSLYGDDF